MTVVDKKDIYMRNIFCYILIWILSSKFAIAELPWKLITENYHKGILISETIDDVRVYQMSNNFELPRYGDKHVAPATVHIEKWNTGEWIPYSGGTVSETMERGLEIDKDSIGKGFYKILYDCGDDPISVIERYFLIEPNWKNEIITYCQNNKQTIYTSLGAHSINASIIISHIDNIQEATAKSPLLTDEILNRLSAYHSSSQQLELGLIPDFAKGLNKIRFKRFEGADFADFAVHVPIDHDFSVRTPLFIHVDPSRWGVGNYGQPNRRNRDNFHEGMIDMWWHSVSHSDLKWKDYLFLEKLLKEKLNIDPDRVYLYGDCYNGMAAMALTVHFPDYWAASLFSTGNSYTHLSGNAYNVPLIFANVYDPHHEIAAYTHFAAKCFKYHQCVEFRFLPMDSDWMPVGMECPQNTKNNSPSKILYSTDNFPYTKAYWLSVIGREDENYIAQMEIIADGQTIQINRTNVDAYKLDLRQAPIDHTQPMTIIDNGVAKEVEPQEIFASKSDKYLSASYNKNGQIHGPISDVFTDAYTVLYTSGTDPKESKIIEDIGKMVAGTGPSMPEIQISDEIIEDRNIVLVGLNNRSHFLQRIAAFLPVEFHENGVIFEEQSISGHVCTIMIYPNPLNSTKYVCLVLASSQTALEGLSKIWKDVPLSQIDIAIINMHSDGTAEYIRCEKFNTVWGWHEHWSVPLARVSKVYPKWRWRQWLAYVIRKQTGVDAVISEEVFESPEIPNFDIITLRDLDRILKNQWIVKIKLNGQELRNMITQSFKQPSISTERKTDNPIIEGICFVKSDATSEIMHISDIESDQYYTVAMPHKLINGKRIGTLLKDYEIVGDGYLIQLLHEYLKNEDSLELDSELDKMKLNML